jgi:hypothetical protein
LHEEAEETGEEVSSTSQVKNFQDLYTDLSNRVRIATGVTATETQAKRYINIAVQDIHLGFDYKLPWAERQGVIRTHAPYSTGTVSISVGSTTLTGSSTLWTTANSYSENNARTTGKLRLAGGNDIYKISTVTNDTSITLAQRYVGSDDLSAEEYVYFEDEYALASDFLRPVDMQSFSDANNIPLIGRAEWRMRYPRPNVSGRPRVASILDLSFNGSTTAVRRVIFYPYPDNVYLIPYTYISSAVAVTSAGVESDTLSSDTDEPTMPIRYRHAIVFHALYHWYRDKRDDARSEAAKAEYVDIMTRITNDQEIGTHVQARIQPRMGMYTRHAYHPYSKRGGRRMDINSEFDRFRR